MTNGNSIVKAVGKCGRKISEQFTVVLIHITLPVSLEESSRISLTGSLLSYEGNNFLGSGCSSSSSSCSKGTLN